MALTNERVREILSSAGVDAEHVRDAANQIIEGHLTSINVMRDEITELKDIEIVITHSDIVEDHFQG